MTKSEETREDSFWLDGETPLVPEETGPTPVYDLEERTARFGESVIDFAKTIPQGPATDRIISHLIGAATTVGANYVEADDSVSKKEFLKCIGTCKKEARETKFFLRMSVRVIPLLKPEARKLWMEANELHLILRRSGETENKENDETRMPKLELMTKRECRKRSAVRHSSLVLPSSFVIRHSSFVSPFVIRASCFVIPSSFVLRASSFF